MCICSETRRSDDSGVVSCYVILGVIPLRWGSSLNVVGRAGCWEWKRRSSCLDGSVLAQWAISLAWVSMSCIVIVVVWFGNFKKISHVHMTGLCWDPWSSCFNLQVLKFQVCINYAWLHNCSSAETVANWQSGVRKGWLMEVHSTAPNSLWNLVWESPNSSVFLVFLLVHVFPVRVSGMPVKQR